MSEKSDPMRETRLKIINELQLALNLSRNILMTAGECPNSPLYLIINNTKNNLQLLEDTIKLNILYEHAKDGPRRSEIERKLVELGKRVRKVLETE